MRIVGAQIHRERGDDIAFIISDVMISFRIDLSWVRADRDLRILLKQFIVVAGELSESGLALLHVVIVLEFLIIAPSRRSQLPASSFRL